MRFPQHLIVPLETLTFHPYCQDYSRGIQTHRALSAMMFHDVLLRRAGPQFCSPRPNRCATDRSNALKLLPSTARSTSS
jgi:hypothetical protein